MTNTVGDQKTGLALVFDQKVGADDRVNASKQRL
jgi:hypothetical protein